jgi:uncharacterized protein YegP (UPF0339 family)
MIQRKATLERYIDKKGEHRWRLLAPNGKIIATSGEGYKRLSDMNKILNRMEAYWSNCHELA